MSSIDFGSIVNNDSVNEVFGRISAPGECCGGTIAHIVTRSVPIRCGTSPSRIIAHIEVDGQKRVSRRADQTTEATFSDGRGGRILAPSQG